MKSYEHPCHRVFISGPKLEQGKLYLYREGTLKATVKYLEDYTDDKYFRYHLFFNDGKYEGKEFLAEITKEPVGYWGIWSIHDLPEILK